MLITAIVIAAFLPDTLLGWAVVVSSIGATISVLAGAILWLMKKMLEVIEAKLDSIRSNQKSNTTAIIGAVGRVEKLEQTLNNGLTERTTRTEAKVEKNLDAIVAVKTQVAEIHGLLTATYGWDGDERRGVV